MSVYQTLYKPRALRGFLFVFLCFVQVYPKWFLLETG